MIEGKGKPPTIGKDVESALENLIYSDTMYDLSRFFFFSSQSNFGLFQRHDTTNSDGTTTGYHISIHVGTILIDRMSATKGRHKL
mmetsp:Transcript_13212/g.23925  ORF Transcript_13212/g.23925 Transcript_13212/m.23925 type:complete len:85 (+) Transcript_13212:839-1093(+)